MEKGDKIEMTLDMPVRGVQASSRLQEDSGKVAIQRGPLMYCLEWKDNSKKPSDIALPANSNLQPRNAQRRTRQDHRPENRRYHN
ncbi:hypothetical protein ACQ86N_29050 [Puia sp. P3]|uniref:hypothetical protein n=1 Tax=Puia sp. P3 TaxID=3423952 RepID=UPI003D676384